MVNLYDVAVSAISEAGLAVDSQDRFKDNAKIVALARKFLKETCPQLLSALENEKSPVYDEKSIEDRLIKIGRNVMATLHYEDAISTSPVAMKEKAQELLSCLVGEANSLAVLLDGEESTKVPKVRYGKTELQMPILSLGCMRFQQSWNRGSAPVIRSIDQVDKECQENLVRILKYAISIGVNHIETAQGYGCSELQIGDALSQLFREGFVKREDLIIQTKGGISASMTPDKLYAQVEGSLKRLQIDYVDLFSLHGLNTSDHHDWLFNHGERGNLIDAVRKLKAEGKIRHLGFSTHAPAHVTKQIIETDEFESVNLHYNWCGSYTCSGDGDYAGNLENVRLCAERDMGVFIISAFDKAGRVYAPSNKMRALMLPDLEPISYSPLFLWHHERLDEKHAPIHTCVCGAARPSDLDQPVLAALMMNKSDIAQKVETVKSRLDEAMTRELGREWVETWHMGVPNHSESKHATHLANIVWLYNLIKGYGMLDFAKDRYGSLENNLLKYDFSQTKEENIVRLNNAGWHWMPGCGVDPNTDYSEELSKCPPENVDRLKKAVVLVHNLCGKKNISEKVTVPLEWETAYDMRPWVAFPERS